MITKPPFINNLDWELLKKKYTNSKKLSKVIEKIKNDYPVQYLIGDVQFLNNKIIVNKNVLIPRFETELLVSKLISYIKGNDLEKSNMIDMCCGSGCIGIALNTEFKDAKILGVDKSYRALSVARKNNKLNKTGLNFMRKDILKDNIYEGKFSVLVSNPPYVKLDEEVSKNTKYEPEIALYPGQDDIIFYKEILKSSKDIMYKKNIIAFEIGATQAEEICKYAKSIYPKATIKVEKDYALYNRFIFIFNNCE